MASQATGKKGVKAKNCTCPGLECEARTKWRDWREQEQWKGGMKRWGQAELNSKLYLFSVQRGTKLQGWGKGDSEGSTVYCRGFEKEIDRQSGKKRYVGKGEGEKKGEGLFTAKPHNKPRRVRRKVLTLSSENCLNRALVSGLPLRITSRITAVCLAFSSFACSSSFLPSLRPPTRPAHPPLYVWVFLCQFPCPFSQLDNFKITVLPWPWPIQVTEAESRIFYFVCVVFFFSFSFFSFRLSRERKNMTRFNKWRYCAIHVDDSPKASRFQWRRSFQAAPSSDCHCGWFNYNDLPLSLRAVIKRGGETFFCKRIVSSSVPCALHPVKSKVRQQWVSPS